MLLQMEYRMVTPEPRYSRTKALTVAGTVKLDPAPKGLLMSPAPLEPETLRGPEVSANS